MHKDPFVVLGVDQNATQAEVQQAYETLRDSYRMEIHLEVAKRPRKSFRRSRMLIVKRWNALLAVARSRGFTLILPIF